MYFLLVSVLLDQKTQVLEFSCVASENETRSFFFSPLSTKTMKIIDRVEDLRVSYSTLGIETKVISDIKATERK